MRKGLVLGTVLLALVAILPAGPASGRAVGAGVVQVAQADWIFLRGDRGTSYLAFADRGVWGDAEDGTNGPTASVLLAKGQCVVDRGRHFTVISCAGTGIWKQIPFERFDVDPLLDSATVTVRARGFRNRVRWTGLGNTPPPGGDLSFGPGYVDAGVGMGRAARATGRIFGDRVRRGRGFSFAGLGQGVGAGVDAFAVFDDVEPTGPGTFRFTRQIRITT